MEDINTCFSCGSVIYEEEPFKLNFNFLSEITLDSELELIANRDWREKFRIVISQLNPTIERGNREREDCFLLEQVIDVDCSCRNKS